MEKTFKIYINDKYKDQKPLDLNLTLDFIRIELGSLLNEEIFFLQIDKTILSVKQENQYTLECIANGNVVRLAQKENIKITLNDQDILNIQVYKGDTLLSLKEQVEQQVGETVIRIKTENKIFNNQEQNQILISEVLDLGKIFIYTDCDKEDDTTNGVKTANDQYIEYQSNSETYMIEKEEEFLKQTYQIYKEIPPSFEKTLLYLTVILGSLKLGKQISEQLNDGNYEQVILDQYHLLKQNIEEEEIVSSEINRALQDWEIAIQNKRWKDLLVKAQIIIKESRDLNVPLLKDLISQVETTAYDIKDKDIILFLGGTGTGKSTTIQYLAESKMRATYINKIYHIGPEKIVNDHAKNIISNPFPISCTKFIAAVPIKAPNGKEILLCDTPGFDDTEGAEIDIANGIGIIMAIKNSKSVIPAILISQHSIGNRFEELKRIMQLLIGMLENYQDYLETVVYIFTKFAEQNRGGINEILKMKQKSEENNNDEAIKTIFEDIIEKTCEEEDLIHLDPLDGKSKSVLRKILKNQKIKDPQNAFRFFITAQSSNQIIKQIQKHKHSIQIALKNQNYSLIIHKLNEFVFLKKILQMEQVQIAYNECVNDIKHAIKLNFIIAQELLNKQLQPGNTLTEEDIKRYQAECDKDARTQELKDIHLGRDALSNQEYKTNLFQETNRILEAGMKEPVESLLTLKYLEKMHLLSFHYPGLKPLYEKLLKREIKELETLIQNFLKEVKNVKYDQSSLKLAKIQCTLENLEKFIQIENCQKIKESLNNDFSNFIETLSQPFIFIFINHENLKEEDIKILNNFLIDLNNLKEFFTLSKILSMKVINDNYQLVFKNIVEFFKEIIKKIFWIFNQEDLDVFSLIIKEIDTLNILRNNIDVIQNAISNDYFNIIEFIIGKVNDIARDTENKLYFILAHNDVQKYQELAESIQKFKKASWVDQLRKGIYSQIYEKIKNQLLDHVASIKTQALEINISLKDFKQLEQIAKITYELKQIKSLDMIDQNFTQNSNNIMSFLIEQLSSLIEQIEHILLGPSFLQKNPQESKEGSQEENQVIVLDQQDYKLCETLLQFFEAFNIIKTTNLIEEFIIIKKKAWETKTFLLQKINIFYTSTQQLITNQLLLIKGFNGQNKNQLILQVSQLKRRILQIEEIKKCTTMFQQLFDPEESLIQQLKNDIYQYAQDISMEMDELQVVNTFELNNKVQIVKALMQLDDYNEGQKFREIYTHYVKTFNHDISNLQQKTIDNITNFKFRAVISTISSLETQKGNPVVKQQLDDILRVLTSTIEELIYDTQSTATRTEFREALTENSITQIVSNLKRINESKLLEHFLSLDFKINDKMQQIQSIVNRNYGKHLKNIQDQIETDHFVEADKEIQTIQLLYQNLEQYCSQEIHKQLESLEICQKNSLNQLIKRYENLELKRFASNPPKEILNKLEKSRMNHAYNRTLQQLSEIIQMKFRDEFELIKGLQSQNEQNLRIKQVENLLQSLSESLQNDLKFQICQLHEEILITREQKDTMFQDAMDSKNLARLEEQYQSARKNKDFQSEQKIFKFLRDEFKQMAQNLEEQIIKTFSLQSIKLIEEIHNIKVIMERNFDKEQLSPFDFVKKKVSQLFLGNLKQFSDIFSQQDITSDSSFESISDIDTQDNSPNYQYNMKYFIKFRVEQENIVKQILPLFDKQFQETCKSISFSIQQTIELYNQSLTQMNFQQIQICLRLFKRWAPFAQKIKEDIDKYAEINQLIEFSQTLQCLPYYEKCIKETIKLCQALKDITYQNCSNLLNDDTKLMNKSRTTFYEFLNKKFKMLKDSQILPEQVVMEFDPVNALDDCTQKFNEQVQILHDEVQSIINNKQFDQKSCEKFKLYHQNLQCIDEIVDREVKPTFINLGQIRNTMNDIIIKIQNDTISEMNNFSTFSEKLASLQLIATYGPDQFQEPIKQKIGLILGDFKKNKKSTDIGQLSVFLQQRGEQGQLIIDSNIIFQAIWNSAFSSKTKKHDIDYVLNKIEGDSIDKNYLQKCFEKYQKTYESTYKKNLAFDSNETLNKNIQSIVTLLQSVVKKLKIKDLLEWRGTFKQDLPDIIAYIAAIWTIQNATYLLEADNNDERENYLLSPHPAQIIAIFRLLGQGNFNQTLDNSLIQIGTGEGKSVTLAITSIIFTLLGYEVNCACYSQYLSVRDFQSFTQLFDTLQVTEFIHYGTFNQLCERIINQEGNIRQIVNDLLVDQSNVVQPLPKKIDLRPQILLIDEVDVFFSKDFYGQIYSPQASIKDPTITNLVTYIWNNRGNPEQLRLIKQSQQFIDCCNRFQKWQLVILEATKDMIADVQKTLNQLYVVKDDKIGYKEQDNIAFNVSFGYQTLFTYFAENEKGNITNASLQDNISIGINCGNFSYAEIPKKFKHIMGVTGTLKSLSKEEMCVINSEYNVKFKTYMPSVFGAQNLKFYEKEHVIVCNEDDYFNYIVQEINKGVICKRSVLIFFESKEILMKFYTSNAFSGFKDNVKILTEESTPKEKDNIVLTATSSGSITLFTRCFGRGTDFKQRDQTVKVNGGSLVIQTFFSSELSEEIQIKGRTARQGDEGSYIMILLDTSLEQFQVTLNEISDNSHQIYKFLCKKRAQYFQAYYDQCKDSQKKAKAHHEQAEEFLKSIRDGKQAEIEKFLLIYNKGAEEDQSSKTICLMDATGSMSWLLEKAKSTVGDMFQRSHKVLQDNGINPNCFVLQFAAYRNYTSPQDKLLQSSPWTSKPEDLKKFLNLVKAEGGWGHEAIEVGFYHAFEEHQNQGITQIILIGDAPPNPLDRIQQNRQKFPKYQNVGDYKDEMQKLKDSKIPIHAFYVADYAKKSFQEIAQFTGGNVSYLDINSSRGSEMLTGLITVEILRNIGTIKGLGNKLVDSYKKSYK